MTTRITSWNAGNMDRVIDLQTATKTQDPVSGEEILIWTSEQLPAQWLPAGSREAWQAQQRLASYIDGVFRIYDHVPRPTPDDCRILFEDPELSGVIRTFDVKPPMEINRGEGLEIPVVARGETS